MEKVQLFNHSVIIRELKKTRVHKILKSYLYYPGDISGYLNLAHDTCGIHSRSLVHRVAPYIENWLSRPDDTADQRTAAYSDSEIEVVKGMNVDVVETEPHRHSVVHQSAEMILVVFDLFLKKYILIKKMFVKITSLL